MRRYDYSEDVVLTEYEEDYPLHIPRRYDVEGVDLTSFINEYEWQVTYKFSKRIRQNTFAGRNKYGASGMTMRRLYVILCEKFNDGNYFIEDYLQNQYPYRIKPEADEFLEKVNKEIMEENFAIMNNARMTKSGKLDKRYTRTLRKLSQYSVMSDERVKEAGEILSERVKLDIAQCLKTGILTLSKRALAASTIEQRVAAGLPPDIIFFASGQLIQNVQIYFRLEKTEWLKQYL